MINGYDPAEHARRELENEREERARRNAERREALELQEAMERYRRGDPPLKPTFLYARDEADTPLQTRRDIFANAVLFYAGRVHSFLDEYFQREGVLGEWVTSKRVVCTKQGVETTIDDGNVSNCDAVITGSPFPAHVDKNTIKVAEQPGKGGEYVSTMPAMRCIITARHGSGRVFFIGVKLVCDTFSNAQTRRIIVANVFDASNRIIYRWLVSQVFDEASSRTFAQISDESWLASFSHFPKGNSNIIGEDITRMFNVGVVGAFFPVVNQFPLTIQLQIGGETRSCACATRRVRGDAFFSVWDSVVEAGRTWYGGAKKSKTHSRAINTLVEFVEWALRVCPSEFNAVVLVPDGVQSFTQIRALLRQVDAHV
jgi:hypothetical protein